MKGTRGIGAASLALSVMVAVAVVGTPGTGMAAGRTSTVQNLAPGVTLTRITDPVGPEHVYVLTINPAKPSTIDIGTPGADIGSYAKPSQIGAARGALAAINGDFSVNPGRPLHTLATDGTIVQTGLQDGASFALSQDKTQAFIDNRNVQITGRRLPASHSFAIADTNGPMPSGGGIGAYTSYGGWAVRPPSNACSVRLKTPGKFHWAPSQMGVVRDWVVSRSTCGSKAMTLTSGTMVLSSHLTGAGSTTLRRMKPGDPVRLKWSFGWAGVMDSVGGMPVLVSNGKALPAAGCNDYFCSRNPRTGIGITADGQILMVVVDGRRNDSVGMTLIEFARYMISLGAVTAINLDGGGGSAMWISGQGVVNHPSDSSGERPVTNAVLVLPGADPGEATPLPYSETPSVGRVAGFGHGRLGARVSAVQGRSAMAAASNDPGSTGGLLDALTGGGL